MSLIVEKLVFEKAVGESAGNIVLGFDPLVLDLTWHTGREGVFTGTFAELLLGNPSTAILHLGRERMRDQRTRPSVIPVLLGVNYHQAHSEGGHEIVVQDVINEVGPWVLYQPPGTNQRRFYLQHMVFPGLYEARFEPVEANPLKIRRYYFHIGDPRRIFEDFEALGYEFINQPMPVDDYEDLIQVSGQ